MFSTPFAQVSTIAPGVPWYWWAVVGVMILLQLVILVVIAGRPSAIAVMGVTLPFLCGVCALGATGIILDYHASVRSTGGQMGPLIPLLYVIWVLCAIVALTTVVLSIAILARKIGPATSKDLPVSAPAPAADVHSRTDEEPSPFTPKGKVSP